MFEAVWTGHYPCLCHGEWQIFKNGEDVSGVIPCDLKNREMGTKGSFQRWFFNDDWSEVWEEYENGLSFAQWVSENPWISEICDNAQEEAELYAAIQSQDWRHGSCGGCI